MPYHFINAVWGRDYVDLFLNVSLPSQLTALNLGAFTDTPSRYRIYTAPSDAQRIIDSPAYRAVSRLMPVDVVAVDQLDKGGHKYALMNFCHNHAIVTANESDAGLVVLSPDTVWSDGTFVAVKRHAEAGKRAVMMHAPRLVREQVLPLFEKRTHDGVLDLPPRELVAIALDHLHGYTKSMFWNSRDYNRWPSQLYWPVEGEGLLAHCFHLHPLYVRPARKDVLLNATIDTSFVRAACESFEDQHIVTDSDELFGIEMTSATFDLNPYIKPEGSVLLRQGQSHKECPADTDLKVVATAYFAQQKADDWHMRYLTHPIRFHQGEATDRWRAVEREARRIIDAITDWSRRDAKQVLQDVFQGGL